MQIAYEEGGNSACIIMVPAISATSWLARWWP